MNAWACLASVGVGIGLAAGCGPAWAASDPVPAATYADGLVVRVVGLEVMPSADAATCSDAGICTPGETPGDRLVRVTVALGLPAGAPSPLALDVVAGTGSGMGLDAGTEHQPAAIDCGNLAETTILCTDNSASVPTGVAPATEVRLCESFDVPIGDLSALDVTIQPPVSDASGANPLGPTTFANVGRLLTDS